MLFHVKRERDELRRLQEQASALGVTLSEDAAGRLVRFEALLAERAIPAGMIAASEAGRLRERHVLDCLRAATVVEPADRTALDLGSGAGLPGLVVAIALPDLAVTLVEGRRRRAAFCELAPSVSDSRTLRCSSRGSRRFTSRRTRAWRGRSHPSPRSGAWPNPCSDRAEGSSTSPVGARRARSWRPAHGV